MVSKGIDYDFFNEFAGFPGTHALSVTCFLVLVYFFFCNVDLCVCMWMPAKVLGISKHMRSANFPRIGSKSRDDEFRKLGPSRGAAAVAACAFDSGCNLNYHRDL